MRKNKNREHHEYLNYLNIGLGSLGESVSGLHAYHKAGHINEDNFERHDLLAFKLENGLLKLIKSIERKRNNND